MAISDSAKVDLLYKKVFGVAKTDTPTNKSPSNEAIASPALLRGDNVWQQATSIPAVAAAVTSIVQAYQTTNRIECTADTTSTPVSSVYPSWKTSLTDWIPPEFGSTYFVKVYAELTGNANPTVGTPLSDSGIAGVGEWNFDYQSGVLNFIGGTIPAALTASKVIYVTGYRYIGLKGVTTFGNVTFGNITVTGNTSGNIVGNVLTTNQPFITSLGNLVSLNVIGNLTAANLIVGNVDLSGLTSNVITANAANISGNAVASWFLGNVQGPTGNFTTSVTSTMFYGNITAQSITSPTADLHISAATNDPNNIIRFDSVSAFDIPSGTTAQRPPNPEYGYVRYNTDIGSIEWWGGAAWVAGQDLIVSEIINPDGTNATYTLGQSTSENAILVNINGTIQQAGSGAYTVVGNQITFAETPLVTDIIEIRYLAGGVAALTTNFANIASNVSPSANVTYDLGSPNYRWRDLWLSGNTINLGSASLSAVGNTIQLPAGSTVGGANVDITAINSNVATVNANVTAANTRIATTNANVAAANSAIITANTDMKAYVDQGLAAALFAASSYGNAVVQAYLPLDPTITTIQANIGAYQIYANANLGAYQTFSNSNAATQATSINTINTNIGAYQTYANANVVAIQANLGAYQTFANAIVLAIQNNLSAYQTYANANAATQAISLTTIDAKIVAFNTYANTKIGTNTNSNLVVVSAATSTSTTTGALVVAGGAGIAGNINVGGNIQLGNIRVGATDFYGNLSQNGWQRFPGGMTMQWGKFMANAASFYLVFPIAFTTSCFVVTATTQVETVTSTGGIGTEVALRTTPNVNGVSLTTASTAGRTIHWTAIGI